MKEFFDLMESTERFYWYVAIAASLVFIVQSIMTFIGADADTGMDADFDSNFDVSDHPFQLFSLRNLVNFFLGFGWAGVSLYSLFESKTALGIVSVLVGMVFIALFFVVMRNLMRLAEDNTFQIEDTVGKTGEVYTTIPALQNGKGKISISIQGTLRELEAVTSTTDDIRPSSLVKVVAVRDNLLLVEPVK